MEADTKTTTNNGLTTPPIASGSPLVYITGLPSSNKKCVAECVATILGDDKSILIDHPYTISLSPPPPSSTPPPPSTPVQIMHQAPPTPLPSCSQAPVSTRPLAPKPFASYSRSIRPTGLRMPSMTGISTKRCRSASTPGLPSLFSDDSLLAKLYQNPTLTGIITDCDPRVKAAEAAAATGRLLLNVQLLEKGQKETTTTTTTAPELPEDTPTLLVAHTDPHGMALSIVEFVNNETGKRRHSEASEWDHLTEQSACVCGVITPARTPAEEKGEILF